MGRRLQPRVRGILPVRIWGTDHEGKAFAEHVCTIDISNKGVSLANVRAALSPGDTVGVQYHNRQARFRVAWVVPANEGQGNRVGLECLQPEKELWPVTTPAEGADPFVQSARHREEPSPLEGRRMHMRFPVSGKAYVGKKGADHGQWAKLGDISLTGCYLQTSDPLEVGRSTSLSIKIAHNEFKATAIVRSCYPGIAMGLEFTFLSNTDRRTLQRLIAHLTEYDTVSR
ncbi:MAG TPA: PilZ domain-containing protein [Terriglobales bacterium]|nr:PilZ domain-containing protein [Terriglobales bacterium]